MNADDLQCDTCSNIVSRLDNEIRLHEVGTCPHCGGSLLPVGDDSQATEQASEPG